jgi:hypothetical protein
VEIPADIAAASCFTRHNNGARPGEQIQACGEAGTMPLVPKPLTSGAKTEARFGKQDFVYIAGDDEYRCPAGKRLIRRYSNVENGVSRHDWSSACSDCSIKRQCTIGKERRIKLWEHEGVIDAMQQRLDRAPDIMRIRRQTRRTPVRDTQSLDRRHTLTDQAPETGEHRDEPARAGNNTMRVIAILGVKPLLEPVHA